MYKGFAKLSILMRVKVGVKNIYISLAHFEVEKENSTN
jgi:hypothetical protein